MPMTWHNVILYNTACLWHNMIWDCTTLSHVPVIGIFDSSTSNCASYKQPSEKVSYCVHNWFIWQIFIFGIQFPNICLITVVTLPWLMYWPLPTMNDTAYIIFIHKTKQTNQNVTKHLLNQELNSINKQNIKKWDAKYQILRHYGMSGHTAHILYTCPCQATWCQSSEGHIRNSEHNENKECQSTDNFLWSNELG